MNDSTAGGRTLAAVVVAAVLATIWSGSAFARKKLEVRFFAAGHGDSILITTPQGHRILIDAGMGKREWGDHLLKRRVLPYFEKNDIDTLDAFFLTHPHYDHVGDPALLRRKVAYSKVLTNIDGARYLKTRKAKLVRAAKGKPLVIKKLWRGDELRFGKLELEVLHPPRRLAGKTDVSVGEQNNRSLVMRATYGKVRFLLTGDIGYKAERWLLRAQRGKLRADVLKLGHHGKGSTSRRWLDAVKPRYAVATCCDRPYYRLKRSLRRRLAKSRVKLLKTDKHRDVMFRTDGETLEVESGFDFTGLGRRHLGWARRRGLLERDRSKQTERGKKQTKQTEEKKRSVSDGQDGSKKGSSKGTCDER
jgi:competence protein ComEC